MPKDTFFNLPEDKRAMICQVALAEFSRNTYESASINRIVANAGIAKGSFYQYFEDKKDLFSYLLQQAAQEKANYISPVLQNPEGHDFFTLLRESYVSGIRFAEEHPEYAEIGNKLMSGIDEPIYREIMADSMPAAQEFFETLLVEAQARGEVRPDIDTKMFAHLIASLNALVVGYFTVNVSGTFDERMLASIDALVDFLKHGIGRSQPAAAAMAPTT